MKLKRLMAVIVMAVSCLLQQGCATYLFAERDGNYFASTDDVWHKKSFPAVESIGLGMITVGVFIPIVGWVTLVPAGAIVHLAEGCVVAPAFDIVCLPVDYAINRWNESKSQAVWNRLDMDFDKTLADEAYWKDEDKIRYLSRWLSEKSDLKDLSGMQVSAILSILRSWLKGKVDIDWRRKDVCQCIVKAVYDKSCDRESLDMLVKGIVEIKGATKVYMFQVIPYEIELAIQNASGDEDSVKFSDEQLVVLRDADIMRAEIDRLLKIRQKKREKVHESGKEVHK